MITVEVTLAHWGTTAKEINRYLKLARSMARGARDALAKRLKTPPPYQYVSWKSIGGFHSSKQAFFVINSMNGNPDFVQFDKPYVRTGSIPSAWTNEDSETPFEIESSVFLDETKAPRGKYVQSMKDQHRRMKRIGWPTPTSVVDNYWPAERAKIVARLNSFQP